MIIYISCLHSADPPSFQEVPPEVLKVSEGQSVMLKCRATGAPKPLVTWKRGRNFSEPIADRRFIVHPGGDLTIEV